MPDIITSSEDLVIIETSSSSATILEANAGGSTGPQGSTGNAGPTGASIVWRGNWSSAISYSNLDVVHRDIASGGNGKAYIAIQPGANHDPMSATTYWQIIVERAASGLVLGPYENQRVLGFVATQAMTIYDEVIRPSNVAQISFRRKNDVTAALPVTLVSGDRYEVEMTNVSGRVYIGYSVR